MIPDDLVSAFGQWYVAFILGFLAGLLPSVYWVYTQLNRLKEEARTQKRKKK